VAVGLRLAGDEVHYRADAAERADILGVVADLAKVRAQLRQEHDALATELSKETGMKFGPGMGMGRGMGMGPGMGMGRGMGMGPADCPCVN
jgi:hypothetical protein